MSEFDRGPGEMRVTMMLADAAQVADSKLFVLGGGINVVPSSPAPLAIAAVIDVPWDQTDRMHDWKLELLDADGMPVMMNDLPVVVAGQFQVSRGQSAQPGVPLPMPLAVNFSGLALPAGLRFAWRLVIDDDTEPDWQVFFGVAEAPTIEL